MTAAGPAGRDQRRAVHPTDTAGRDLPRVAREGGLWRVRSLEAARQVLRARHQTTQAGFTAEYIPQGRMAHRPILISDGPLHDRQRSEVARFFAPAVVEGHRAMVTEVARRRLTAAGCGPFRLDDLALYFAVEVTAEVVGLTHARWRDSPRRRERRIRAMAHRLVRFFDQPPFDLSRRDLGRTRRQWARAAAKGIGPVVGYHLADVRPAVRERRRSPSDDVIGHLVVEGWGTPEILVEAVTYGTAGMVTTREFITLAAWHLLTTPALADRFRDGSHDERLAVLQELIRLEPVVGHLYRRTSAPVTVADHGREVVLPAGELVDVDLRAAHADPAALADPLLLCPHRAMPEGVRPAGLAFGDGAHKCPGEALALLEAEVLLSELLGHGARLVHEPSVGWDELVAGYEVRGLVVQLDHPTGRG